MGVSQVLSVLSQALVAMGESTLFSICFPSLTSVADNVQHTIPQFPATTSKPMATYR